MKKYLLWLIGSLLLLSCIICVYLAMQTTYFYKNPSLKGEDTTSMTQGQNSSQPNTTVDTSMLPQAKDSLITPTITPSSLPTKAPVPTTKPTPSPHPDRYTLCEGFFSEPLSDTIIERIDGISYHENDNITLNELRYLNVLYVDFDGNTQTGELICNQKIALDFLEIFKALYDASYRIEKIRLVDEYQADDDLSCADNNTSCFNYRVVAGSNSLSKHALGLAIDINPFYNPYITYPNGKENISPIGSEMYANRELDDARLIKKNDLCYTLFIQHGFTWGGEWKSLKDFQHFQKSQ